MKHYIDHDITECQENYFYRHVYITCDWPGTFTPLHPALEIPGPWQEEPVISFPPEVIGDLWANRTGPRNLLLLARMVAEKKLGGS
ncbi:MAG: hypothetical protein EHM79_16700 [Geobacter sp.]|nr:MAG: hypothetical protein EHM79_16700 [Geobacter sp.]